MCVSQEFLFIVYLDNEVNVAVNAASASFLANLSFAFNVYINCHSTEKNIDYRFALCHFDRFCELCTYPMKASLNYYLNNNNISL